MQVAYHTPPRFPIHVIECIRQGASMLFQSFGLRDFARIDGWFLPNHVNLIPTLGKDIKFGLTESGTILFTDINLVCENVLVTELTKLVSCCYLLGQ